ncbi:hypothetical protein [Pseudodesulfovibrio methanolicus]|uniref:DUF3887 domain-containing protein n=1 Tax=Pseudodesulfovibrio methanolicus TaxID=3126690 RepID=A0ABZ2IY21_9BACT
MRIPICLAASLLLLLMACPSPSAAFQASGWKQQGPEFHAEKFLDLMVEGRVEDAFRTLMGNDRTDTLIALKQELESEYAKDGKPLGYERILKQRVGKSLIRLRYLLLFPKMPRVFDIYYYNPDGRGWEPRSFAYGRDIKNAFAR